MAYPIAVWLIMDPRITDIKGANVIKFRYFTTLFSNIYQRVSAHSRAYLGTNR
jgi:hypothetical protein